MEWMNELSFVLKKNWIYEILHCAIFRNQQKSVLHLGSKYYSRDHFFTYSVLKI
jgi:hypothetical protein